MSSDAEKAPFWSRRSLWVAVFMGVAAVGAIGGLLADRQSKAAHAADVTSPADMQAAFRQVYPTGVSQVVREGQTVEMTFSPRFLHRLDARTQVLVSVGKTADEDCHMCSGAFSVAYLSAGAAPAPPYVGFGSMGGLGSAPEVELITLGGAPTLLVRSMFSGQGETEVWADLIALPTTRAGVRPLVGAVPLAYDNAGSADDCAIKGRLVATGDGGDFAVAYSGTFSGVVIYRLATDGRYASQSPAPLHERCRSAAAP